MFTLQPSDKFRSPEIINKHISAEIPSQATQPRLFNAVTSFMVHGPCGNLNPKSPCMIREKCNKNFPKSFNSSTTMNVSGYPNYRRRKYLQPGISSIVIKGKHVDNRFIVPYNPRLLLTYNAHINVEACTSLKCVRYIYKYIYKGYDCASVFVGNPDEIAGHIENRYMSAPEASWHLNTFRMHGTSHSITHLTVHLELMQSVTFHQGFEQLALDNSGSTLTAWFDLNVVDSDARQYLYTQIPLHYTYNKSTKKWNRRKRFSDKIVSRMYGISPTAGDAYFLRLMLLHVPGAKSFQDLRTVDGVVYNNFKEAAIALHLLDDDSTLREFLQECNDIQMPPQVREAFAYILIFHEPREPLALWNEFRDDLSLDFLNAQISNDQRFNLALLHIQSVLIQHNKSCNDYHLPIPVGEHEEPSEDPVELLRIAEERIQTLNVAQNQAFNSIKSAVESCDHSSANCFFIDGPGGSGKTYLYETLIKYMRGKNVNVYPLATTGIAATLLPGGNTVHSGFKLPLQITETTVCNLTPRMSLYHSIRESKLIIIDEISMLSKFALIAIDRLLKEMMKNDNPFGGKVFVVGGDFRQTLPVVKGGGPRASIEMCVKSCDLWENFNCLPLIHNMRVINQQGDFSELLLRIGNGTETSVYNDLIHIDSKFITSREITDEIFENMFDEGFDITESVILTSTNINMHSVNEKIISILPSVEKVYLSADTIISTDESDIMNYPVEFFNSLCPSGFPTHRLVLKVGAVVMLIRNLNRKKKLCNGTRLVIEELHNNFVVASKIVDKETVIIPKIDLYYEENDMPFKFKRKQFPLIPAFAMTINKSQGQSFNHVGIMLNDPVFSHGQLYVAMSRCRNADNLKIKITESLLQGKIFKDNRSFTKNIVYKEVINELANQV